MTVTFSAATPRVPPRGPRARLRAALSVAALLALTGPLAVPAVAAANTTVVAANAPAAHAAITAATPGPSPDPTPGRLAGEIAFGLSPVGNGTVRPGEGLTVSVSLRNDTSLATEPAEVTLALGASPLPDRGALAAWLGEQSTGVPLASVASTTLDAVAPGGEQVNAIVIPATDPALAGRGPGVYPLSATYETAQGPVTATSTMIVPRDGAAEVGIAVIVPVTAGAGTQGLLTAAELTELTSPTGSLTHQLEAVEGTAAILAVDPAIAAAIRVLGNAAPESATAWLARLEALGNSRFALQFGDADVAVQLQAGLTRPLALPSLQAYIDPADFVPLPGATPAPAPAPQPGEPVIPGTGELFDIGGEREGVYWPATGTATPGVIAALGGIDVDDRGSLTLVPSTSTASGAAGATVPGSAVAGQARLLVYDAGVSQALHEASMADTATRGAALTTAAAHLAFAGAESDGNPIVVTVDRGEDRTRVGLSTAISTATQAPGVTPLTLPGIVGHPPASVEIADAPIEQTRVDAASALLADETELSRFATILDDASLLTGPERAEILQLLAVQWPSGPVSWPRAIGNHRERTAQTLDSVGILPPSPINLFSAGAPIPIWVRNDLPYPVNVVLYATPDDLRLDVAAATEAVAGPQSNTRVQVPVRARVGNGDVTVQLQLRSRTLEPIGDPQSAAVNVRADWESAGIVVLSVLVGAFILLGAVRTVLRLRARRARKHQATDAAAAGSDEGTA